MRGLNVHRRSAPHKQREAQAAQRTLERLCEKCNRLVSTSEYESHLILGCSSPNPSQAPSQPPPSRPNLRPRRQVQATPSLPDDMDIDEDGSVDLHDARDSDSEYAPATPAAPQRLQQRRNPFESIHLKGLMPQKEPGPPLSLQRFSRLLRSHMVPILFRILD